MEQNNQPKQPNYLKRISNLQKELEELKFNVKTLQNQIQNIFNALKRK